ncbi:TonB-dependent receptor [Spirosoma validum]|uniref:TonB-dependent receptor n=1 Tax=Spirosoma validum TaxID=2771355 RepID=A0A927B6B1_9BACT|nr:TonB-dependent receptor [Spirosoma validum]MBD2756499.1 TonB-dependent receptor [Spirosoma validum]
MKNVILLFFTIFLARSASGQDTLRISVRHALTNQPIPGATILRIGTTTGAATDTAGYTQFQLPPPGPHRLRISAVGFQSVNHTVITSSTDTLRIALEPSEEELDEITVSSTRSGRTVADEPTRVEVIDAEELDEKANMQPANIAVILRESPGIQVQQTSVMSANATFRIQGLDGRYTQLLQDGLPLYSGFSSGLSLMQVPPLNLKQVELIKGCQSTLYGSGAIAGLVNLVTKEPTRERDLSFLINGTSALGLDLNGYYAQRNDKVGVTFYATRNLQRAFDPNHDQFSDLPQIARTTLQPKFFWYPSPTTTLSAGLIWTEEQRTGGYLPTIKNESITGYTEANNSRRLATQFRLEKRFANDAVLTVKNSFSRFKRAIVLPNYRFDGLQQSSFSEVSYFKHYTKSDWIAGLNVWTDSFRDDSPANEPFPATIYRQTIAGVFIQNTLTLSDRLSLETGLRADVVSTQVTTTTGTDPAKVFLLPRFSLLYRASEHWTSRLGGGLGYKAPTIFTEDAERLLFRNVDLRSIRSDQTESSMGLNWDINYRTTIGDETTLSVNQLFFYTQLNRLTVLSPTGLAAFRTANGHLSTRGFETNVRLGYHDVHGFLGYSFIDTQRRYDNLTGMIPLTAKHRLYFTTLYETDKLKTGFEAFYSGPQQRTNGTITPSYWTLGYMIEKKWSFGRHAKGSVFINFENFLDVRQSRFETLVTGTPTQPNFVTDIYAPTDGRVINGGIKLKL